MVKAIFHCVIQYPDRKSIYKVNIVEMLIPLTTCNFKCLPTINYKTTAHGMTSGSFTYKKYTYLTRK